MALVFRSKTLSVSIESDPDKVYEFVSNPKNLPKWATTFCQSIRRFEGNWIVDTPQGPMTIRIVGPNDFGVLDHYVSLTPGTESLIPMRVVPNGSGSEVIFTLFQSPGVSDEKYAEDIGLVERDLRSLKEVLEA
ncbi:MAG TPA: hypothetical protein VE689_04415 [Candidatus Udaeobacter sp.]|jgi:hypothetical protein|nr:hypothetical protein [Candidatus Udaeobacter sp.]